MRSQKNRNDVENFSMNILVVLRVRTYARLKKLKCNSHRTNCLLFERAATAAAAATTTQFLDQKVAVPRAKT